ncbi:hypothetical protein RI129_009016 [Pyrocoelia pectoralis]|uniref:Transposase n=1 Tax=Pyrocoelia pectoralis TaxID=417401 RepID=A0AAN7VAY2_9COLE
MTVKYVWRCSYILQRKRALEAFNAIEIRVNIRSKKVVEPPLSANKPLVLSIQFGHILANNLRPRKMYPAHIKLRSCPASAANSIRENTGQQWLKKFRSGDFILEDAPRSGRHTVIQGNDLKTLVEADPSQTGRGIAEELDVGHTAVAKRSAFESSVMTGDVRDAECPPRHVPKALTHKKKTMVTILWSTRRLV